MMGMKHEVRKAQLRYVRQWARTNPTEARAESEAVSALLFDYIKTQNTRIACARHASRGPLFVCVYLPLYYEVDLQPLMHQLWAWKRERASVDLDGHHTAGTQRDVCIMVPVVLDAAAAESAGLLLPPCRKSPPFLKEAPQILTEAPAKTANDVPVSPSQPLSGAFSGTPASTQEDCGDYDPTVLDRAMVFVEVKDATDLGASFEESGRYKIRELKRSILQRFFRRSAEPHAAPDAVDVPTPRRLLLCDTWERLFPMFQRPRGVVDWETAADANTRDGGTQQTRLGPRAGSQLIVVAPGVRFDAATGARLGKGGGFYDRFLSFHRAQSQRHRAVESASASSQTGESAALMRVVGVGFRCQCTHATPQDAQPTQMTSELDAVTALPVPFDPTSDVGVDVVATAEYCTLTHASFKSQQ